MNTLAPKVHVCFGNTQLHREELQDASDAGTPIWWNFNKSAVPGDRVVFYMIGPVYAFVAAGEIEGEPGPFDDKSSEWYGRHGADVKDIHMLPRSVSLAEAKKQFPEWGFLRQPRRSSPVPPEWAKRFFAFLNPSEAVTERPAVLSDIEGTKTEVVILKSQRSRRLRTAAFQSAMGVCEVCGRDWSKVLRGRGVRVLQVHHRRQLSAKRVPSLTRVEDLAVVCANCHLLLHLDPAKALSVEELRDMLRRDQSS